MHASSNFPHRLPFVIQAWDFSQERWLDTIHGGLTFDEANRNGAKLRDNNKAWMPGLYERKLRIVTSKT